MSALTVLDARIVALQNTLAEWRRQNVSGGSAVESTQAELTGMLDAHAAVLELLAADKEHDAAAFNYNADTATDEQCDRLSAAAKRRQRAIARVQGGVR